MSESLLNLEPLLVPDHDDTPLSTPPSSPPKNPPESRKWYISVPQLSLVEKNAYREMPKRGPKEHFDIPVDEIVGEYIDNGVFCYYARFQGGIIHRFPAKAFEKNHPDLVEAYEELKAREGTPDFNPSSSQVHPMSRVRMKINIRNNRAKVSIGSESGSVAPPSDDDFEDESSSNGDSESQADEDYDTESLRPSRNLRSKGKQSKLPFSPRKTRSQKVFVVSDSDAESDGGRPATRRSTRAVKVPLRNSQPETEGETSDAYSEFAERRRKPAPAKGKRSPPKTYVHPAYGLIRSAADLEYDDGIAGETAHQHRSICEKCHTKASHVLLAADKKKPKARTKKKRHPDDDPEDSVDETERLTNLGGWVRCLRCPVSAHWKCLARTQQDEILRAVRDRDAKAAADLETPEDETPGEKKTELSKRKSLESSETTEFICGACRKGGICMECMDVALLLDGVSPPDTQSSSTVQGKEQSSDEQKGAEETFFRCFTCKRLSHYYHLPVPSWLDPQAELSDIVAAYQSNWLCRDCVSFTWDVEKILAWRPYPSSAVEPLVQPGDIPNYKNALPREYLVKWKERSYRRTSWVPHMWVLQTHQGLLRHFIQHGAKVELNEASKNSMDADDNIDTASTVQASRTPQQQGPPLAMPDAEDRIPVQWKTVDRVLDVRLWHPAASRRAIKKSKKNKSRRIESDVEDAELPDEEWSDWIFEMGNPPEDEDLETIEEWEDRAGKDFTMDEVDRVVWAFYKWDDLGYDEATWDSPPRSDDPSYIAFAHAMERFLKARAVKVPKKTGAVLEHFENRRRDEYRTKYALRDASELDLGQDSALKLMPFQVDGFNWLCNNWWNKQPCILADEMGLGKTVQISSFIAKVATTWQAFPALVVVPNSTITNWVREFERWAPRLRVVPFYGEAKAREVIKQYELSHSQRTKVETGAKFHVLIATYESLLGAKDFGPVFKSQPRWEVLIVDEGQRLKSDTSLLFRKLNELRTFHRIIMTGTPLNNNIRELFNLMNFLDPSKWNNLAELEKEYEELTEERVRQLHDRLRPYFLRRIKSEVLQLPPKNEIIVPLSMAPLQKEVYRSILSHNVDILKGLSQGTGISTNSQGKSKISNVLMQLRKCLQHPYLYADHIEPHGLPPKETHEKLIDASTKLRFLRSLLPKLKARGHRVLLFSQFKLALDILEDFLNGEGIKYLRLDGDTKGSNRQKGMDEFNRPGSDVFIYLLTTRAGGVGINLFTADTVIIFDPDFNPHQDLQAIARAHRYGQQKTCLVFKLMVKESAEDRIMQIGKKKLVLDHLIVQKMDDDDGPGDNLQSILTYGAKALFDSDAESRDIVYSDNDVTNLIERTEKEGDQDQKQSKEAGFAFSFGKIWTADPDVPNEIADEDQKDSWAQTLEKITAEREAEAVNEVMMSGRGVRRKAAVLAKEKNAYVDDPTDKSPVKTSKKRKSSAPSTDNEGSAYAGSDPESDSEYSVAPDDAMQIDTGPIELNAASGPAIQVPPEQAKYLCALCGKRHTSSGQCRMTDVSKNLVEYREMLMLHAEDEPIEVRRAAVEAIEETLYARGHGHMIENQPLFLVEKDPQVSILPPQKRQHNGLSQATSSQAKTLVHTHPPTPTSGAPLYNHATSAKRPPSPTPLAGHPSTKKAKSPLLCDVCGQSAHSLTACPLVVAGPKSVTREIVRLDDVPGMSQTVASLRKILAQQKKAEAAVANS